MQSPWGAVLRNMPKVTAGVSGSARIGACFSCIPARCKATAIPVVCSASAASYNGPEGAG